MSVAPRTTLALLQQADALTAGWACPASTECCRFAVTGREPYLTHAEWQLLVVETKRQGRKLPAVPDDDDGRCAFLNEQGRCRVYAVRPLGCRTFFCERASGPHPLDKAALQTVARDLSDVHHDKARPLRAWLNGAANRSATCRQTAALKWPRAT